MCLLDLEIDVVGSRPTFQTNNNNTARVSLRSAGVTMAARVVHIGEHNARHCIFIGR
jgi:hypothetical protein